MRIDNSQYRFVNTSNKKINENIFITKTLSIYFIIAGVTLFQIISKLWYQEKLKLTKTNEWNYEDMKKIVKRIIFRRNKQFDKFNKLPGTNWHSWATDM